ncbi:MAG: DUF3386 family protein [Planctomycetaceae bacterium]|nr:DUF3386 family protein [Planctomycetaceae bacterium]
MKTRLLAITAFTVFFALAASSPAWAHFVWITVAKDSAGQPQAQVHFSELAEPDSANLLDKVAAVQVWTRTDSGQPKTLKLAKQITDEIGSWVAPIDAGTFAVSGSIKYGVLDRRGMTFLLWYHAKHLDAGAADFKALARDERLTFDLVPHAGAKSFELEALFDGKPAAGSEVVVLDPEGNESTSKTNAEGRLSLPSSKPGLYSIRAKWTIEKSGTEDGKAYPQVVHYSTLALRVPEKSREPAAQASVAQPSAAELLNRAREGRVIWSGFPGFEADLTLYAEGRQQQGRVVVAADGGVTLTGFKLKDDQPIVTALRSLVGHRLGSGESDDRVSFADEQTDHPLGRLIKLDYDSAMASTYRLKDDVIREVNRQMDGGRFTISVFDVNRSAEGKYLPGYYTVNFWNKDGSLRSSTSVRETWVRVGQYDLPATHVSVAAGKDEHKNVSMKFSNHKLLK